MTSLPVGEHTGSAAYDPSLSERTVRSSILRRRGVTGQHEGVVTSAVAGACRGRLRVTGHRSRRYRELLDIADMLKQRSLSCLTARIVTDSRCESFPQDALKRFERHSQVDVLAVDRQRGGVAIGKCPLDRPFEVPQAKRPVVLRQQRIGALVA